MKREEQKLKHFKPGDRKLLALTASSNRRARDNYLREKQRQQGKNVCSWCGAEPCGHLWSRPSEDIPAGERCCENCSHAPVESWQHTHTAWDGNVPYAVCGIRMREGDVVYMRRDGIIMFLEMAVPAPNGAPGEVPAVAFLGADGGVALYTGGEGGPEHTNLWEKKRELDLMWLPIRMGAAVAFDAERKRRLAELLAQEEAEWLARETERRREEDAKRAADIAKRQLDHETKTVLGEVGPELALEGEDEDTLDMDLDLEDALKAPGDSAATADGESAPAKEPAPAVKLSLAELKQPRPVKKGPGRPKRSKRQREARKRQKRAWARQEAAARLEVKRLERLSRNSGESLVKEDE